MANYYYSGQGSLLIAERDEGTGKPKGFLPVGNVPELTINIETSKLEHKESETGSRLTDLTIITEKKGTFEFKLENLSLDNLAMGLWVKRQLSLAAPSLSVARRPLPSTSSLSASGMPWLTRRSLRLSSRTARASLPTPPPPTTRLTPTTARSPSPKAALSPLLPRVQASISR